MTSTDSTSPRSADSQAAARDALADSLRQIVAEAEQWMKSAQAEGGASVDDARARMESRLRDAKAKLADHADDALLQARAAARQADDAVHAHPYAAMGVAAGVGVLVGLLLARR